MKNDLYDSSQIEQWGIDAVGVALSHTDTLCRYFKENDKTPLRDGSVIIYKGKNRSKQNIIGEVNIQLKGKLATEEKLKKENISYSVEINDLIKYKENSGVIYFVTLINRHEPRQYVVFYETLTPRKIRNYIKSKEQQKTCKINLKRLPQGKHEIQTIFLSFFEESKLGDVEPVSLDEISSLFNGNINISASITQYLTEDGIKPSPIEVLLNSELLWKVKLPYHSIPIPIDFGTRTMLTIISREGLPAILVNGERYVDYISITSNKNNVIYKFGQSTTFTATKNTSGIKIKFDLSGLLSDRIKDLKFIISLIETRKLVIEGKDEWSFGEILTKCPFKLEETKDILEYYKKIESFWKSLKINEDFDIDNIDSNSSFEQLDILMRSIGGKELVQIDFKESDPCGLFKQEVSNFNILLLWELVDKEKQLYKIYNYSDYMDTPYFKGNSNENILLIYSALKTDDFIELSNIDLSDILPSFNRVIPLNDGVYTYVNDCLLKLLLAFDKHKGRSALILETAKEIATWLLEESGEIFPYEIKVLNYLQTIKRDRELTVEEIKKLYEVSEKTDSLMNKLGANLLLENYMVASLQFEELKDEEKESFKSFPIYRFWQ